jgi:hypothetical protein
MSLIYILKTLFIDIHKKQYGLSWAANKRFPI